MKTKKKRRSESKAAAAGDDSCSRFQDKKIAGKSIPLEKLVTRKACKFQSQNQYFALPALELAYLFNGIARTPRTLLNTILLTTVSHNSVSGLMEFPQYLNHMSGQAIGSISIL